MSAIYIAPDGDDGSSGNELYPVHTLDRASALSHPGGMIHYTQGVHQHLTQQTMTQNGNEEERIVVCPVPGHKVAIDGSGSDYQTLVMLDGDFVTFRGIEVRNSSRQGIGIYRTKDVRVEDCDVHHCWETGIIAEGTSVDSNKGTVIEHCRVHHNVNHNLTGEPGYGQGISLSIGSGAVARSNLIYNNKGEGLGAQKGHVAPSMLENVLWDNYKINIYNDSSSDSTIEGNFCFSFGNPDYLTYNTLLRCTGITFARETGSGKLNAISCKDNTVVGCHYGISFFEQRKDSGLTNSIFEGNAIIKSVTAALHIEPSGASNNRMRNNIFFPRPLFEGDLAGFVFEPADPQFVRGMGNNAILWSEEAAA